MLSLLVNDRSVVYVTINRLFSFSRIESCFIFNAKQYINRLIHAFNLLLLVINHSAELLPVISANRLAYTIIQAISAPSAFSRQWNDSFRAFFSEVCHVLMTEYTTVSMTDDT